MESINIQYTLTAKICIEDIANYLRRTNIDPKSAIKSILDYFEKKIQTFPLGCQVCPELLKIGCVKYRECNTPDGYRILYSVGDETVTVHALLSQKQDIQQLLFKRLISA